MSKNSTSVFCFIESQNGLEEVLKTILFQSLAGAGALPLDQGFPCLKQCAHGVIFTHVFASEGFKEQAKQLLAGGDKNCKAICGVLSISRG